MKPCSRIIGLTGSIATGKSTVTEELSRRDYKIVDADRIAHDIIKPFSPAYFDIIQEFGKNIVLDDGNIDRARLGNIVFNDICKLDRLNNITHPRIMDTVKKEINSYDNDSIIFVDIPLLYEQEDMLDYYNISFDAIVLVYTDEESQLKRLMKRDGIDKKMALRKIRSQINIEDKREKADYIIDNRGSKEELRKEIDRFENNILK